MYPGEENFYDAILVGAMVLASFVIAFVMIVVHYQKRKIALHKTRVRSEINALEKERARIAGDLHDDLGASLSAIKLRLQCLSFDNEKEKAIIAASENYIDEAMLKLRRISFNMMPQVLERRGLYQASA
jgi:two-component system, NarL family, sensor kinase